MTDLADATGTDSTCAGCGNPLPGGARCEAGCPDTAVRTADVDGDGDEDREADGDAVEDAGAAAPDPR